MSTYSDGGRYLTEFQDEIIVRCPNCQKSAKIFAGGKPYGHKGVSLACHHCGYSKHI
ncbi:MAG: hypothetical protein OEZ68_16920 [Gammaproteobacteria bacterium]|nr:hypothetical protein [Gammaproteobacteria bacterium]MDH5802487.1 hypothetical protein [Gammaproteobacteria bacterium]